MRGTIKWFNHAKNKDFGFITPLDGSQDAFVHKSELSPEDLLGLAEGDLVEFEIVTGNVGPAAVRVRRVGSSATGTTSSQSVSADTSIPLPQSSGDVLTFLRPHERVALGVDHMSVEQRHILLNWGMHMYGLGQHRVANIEAIKYDGRVVVLDDGSRWLVDSTDHIAASVWNEYDRVVVIDYQMFLLDESESIHVEEELD